MAFERLTLTALIQRTKADMQVKLSAGGAWLRRSVTGVLARVLAAAASDLYGYIDRQAKNLFTDTSDEDHVRREAAQWGLTPTAAVKATGTVNMTGTLTTPIDAGTVLQRADLVHFETVASVTLTSSPQAVAVRALVAGAAGNTSAATPLSFVSPIAGINSTATVTSGGLAAGANEEDVESLRSRLIDRKQNPPRGGSDADFKRWVKEVFSSAKVWVYPKMSGPATVGVAFVLPDREDIIPTSGDIAAVQAYLNPLRPVCCTPTAFAPIADNVNVTLWINPDTPQNRASAEAALADAMSRTAEPAGTTYKTHLDEAVSTSAGEFDHGITIPAGNVTAPAGHINRLGTVTWISEP